MDISGILKWSICVYKETGEPDKTMSIWDEVDALDTKPNQEVNVETVEEIVEEELNSFDEEPDYSKDVYEIKIERLPKKSHRELLKGLIFVLCGAAFVVTVISIVVTLSESGQETREFQQEMDALRNLQSHSISETNLSGGVGTVWDKVVESE